MAAYKCYLFWKKRPCKALSSSSIPHHAPARYLFHSISYFSFYFHRHSHSTVVWNEVMKLNVWREPGNRMTKKRGSHKNMKLIMATYKNKIQLYLLQCRVKVVAPGMSVLSSVLSNNSFLLAIFSNWNLYGEYFVWWSVDCFCSPLWRYGEVQVVYCE